MKQWISYLLAAGAPGWPGNPTLEITPHSVIGEDSQANTSVLHLFNHFGSHFDAPRHFNPDGPSLEELPMETFFYDRPLLLDVPKGPGEKINPEDLAPHAAAIAGADLLMLRTGFGARRESDPQTYMENGPGVSSRSAAWLKESALGLKAIALDFISLASYCDQEDGTLAHQILLGRNSPGYICIIEDVNLEGLPREGFRAVAAPLRAAGVDSGPVTMWVEW